MFVQLTAWCLPVCARRQAQVLTSQQSEEVVKAREANAAFMERMKHMADKSAGGSQQ